MLPDHWVDHSISRLNTSTKSRYPGRNHDDTPLVQHGGENNHHIVGVHRVEIFRQISLQLKELV